jgi:hypothetical protein
MVLSADKQPLDERFRKARVAHALLDHGNLVGHTRELDNLVVQVCDRKSGSRITVARLSDRPRIQEVAAR